MTLDGKMDGESFAKSIISYLDIKVIPSYFKALKEEKFEGQFSFSEY